MPGSISWTPIPSSPKQAANAATFNAVWTQFATGNNNHMTGVTGYRHLLTEIDSAVLDDTISPPAISTALTDLNTRMAQFAVTLSKIMGGTGGTNWAAREAALPSDITTLNTAVGGATSANTYGTIVKRALSDGSVNVGQLLAVAGSGTANAGLFRGAAGDPNQIIWAVENNAGTIVYAEVDNTAKLTVGGVLVAGSAITQVTDATGKVLSAALNIVQPAQGGLGVANPTTGNVLVGAGASAVTATKAAPAGAFVGDSDTQTLSNKTLTTPIINAGALSGTFTGSPTVSGNPVYSGAPSFTGVPNFAAGATANEGTLTANAPALSHTAIWNNAGVAFQGLFVNITNTASGAASRLFDFQVASASKVSGDVAGNLVAAGSGTFGSGAHTVITAAGLLDMTQATNILPPVNGGTGVASPVAGGVLVANGASAMTTVAPGAVGNILQNVAGAWVSQPFSVALIPAASLPWATISDLSIGTSTTTLVLTVSGNIINSAGVMKTLSAATLTLTAPVGNSQWAAVYSNDSGALAANLGTLGGSRDTAVQPTSAATPVGWAFMPSGCTGLYPSQAAWSAAGSPAAKGWIDTRPVGVAAITPASGILASSTLATIGAPGTSGDTGGVSVQQILAGTAPAATVNGITFTQLSSDGTTKAVNNGIAALSTGAGGGTTDSTLDNLMLQGLGAQWELSPHTMLIVSGATVQAAATAGLVLNGHFKYNAAASNTLTISGAAGLRDVFADSTDNGGVGGNGFKIVAATRASAFGTTPATAGANQRLIGTLLFDGTNVAVTASNLWAYPDLTTSGIVSPTQIRMKPAYTNATPAQTISGATFTVIDASKVIVDLTRPMDFIVFATLRANAMTAGGICGVQICTSGASDAGNNNPTLNSANGVGYDPGVYFGQSTMQTDLPPTLVSLGTPGRYAIGLMAKHIAAQSYVVTNTSVLAIPTLP